MFFSVKGALEEGRYLHRGAVAGARSLHRQTLALGLENGLEARLGQQLADDLERLFRAGRGSNRLQQRPVAVRFDPEGRTELHRVQRQILDQRRQRWIRRIGGDEQRGPFFDRYRPSSLCSRSGQSSRSSAGQYVDGHVGRNALPL